MYPVCFVKVTMTSASQLLLRGCLQRTVLSRARRLLGKRALPLGYARGLGAMPCFFVCYVRGLCDWSLSALLSQHNHTLLHKVLPLITMPDTSRNWEVCLFFLSVALLESLGFFCSRSRFPTRCAVFHERGRVSLWPRAWPRVGVWDGGRPPPLITSL